MRTTRSRPKLVVSTDGHGVVSHAGSRLLADLADATGLTGSFANALHRLRPRATGHDPGRVAVDLAVMLADGGEATADLALLRDQREVFGPVASTSTAGPGPGPGPGTGTGRAGLVRPRRGSVSRAGSRRPATRRSPGQRRGLCAVRRVWWCRCRPGRARPGRHPRHLPLREGTGGRHLQTRLRLPSAAVLPGQHRRGPGRPAAAGQRRCEHRERPHHRPGRRPRPDPRCPPPRHRHPHPRRQRRRLQSVPDPPAQSAGSGHPDLLLRRTPRHRTGPARDPGPAQPNPAPGTRHPAP